MDVSNYDRLVSSFAARLTDNPESRKEFCQDAYMRIHQLSKLYPEDSLSGTEFWHKQVHTAVRNLMRDSYRRNKVRRRYYAPPEVVHSDGSSSSLIDSCRDSSQNQFESLAVKYAIEELFRVLTPEGCRILSEILNPSPGFIYFMSKRRALHSIWNTNPKTKKKVTSKLKWASADPAIGEYLQITPKEFEEHIKNINFHASSFF